MMVCAKKVYKDDFVTIQRQRGGTWLTQHNTAGEGTPSGSRQMSSASALVQSKDLSKGLTLRSSIELIYFVQDTHICCKRMND